jgi:hypothetical protein
VPDSLMCSADFPHPTPPKRRRIVLTALGHQQAK